MLQDSSHAKVKIKLLYICDCINILLSDLSPWLVSIETQLWWCFGSSIGNLTMLREKLDSITEHICNIHSFKCVVLVIFLDEWNNLIVMHGIQF